MLQGYEKQLKEMPLSASSHHTHMLPQHMPTCIHTCVHMHTQTHTKFVHLFLKIKLFNNFDTYKANTQKLHIQQFIYENSTNTFCDKTFPSSLKVINIRKHSPLFLGQTRCFIYIIFNRPKTLKMVLSRCTSILLLYKFTSS